MLRIDVRVGKAIAHGICGHPGAHRLIPMGVYPTNHHSREIFVHLDIENAMRKVTDTAKHHGIKQGQRKRKVLCNVEKRESLQKPTYERRGREPEKKATAVYYDPP